MVARRLALPALGLVACFILLCFASCRVDGGSHQQKDERQPPSEEGEEGGEETWDEEGAQEGDDGGEEEGEEEEEAGLQLPGIPENDCYKRDRSRISDLRPHISYEVPLPSGGKLVVLDRVLVKEQATTLLKMMQSRYTTWLFHGFDPTENVSSKVIPENHAPWTASLPASGFSASQSWQSLRDILNGVVPGEGELTLASLTAYVLRWGDQLTPDLGHPDDDSYVVQIYFDDWKRNFYGETLLLERGNIVAAGIHPRRGRVAVFPATARRLMHPPAIDYPTVQHLLELRVVRSFDGVYDKLHEREEFITADVAKRNMELEDITFKKILGQSDEPAEERDPADYVTKRYNTSNGDSLMVFDGYLDEDDVMKLRHYIMHGTIYTYDLSSSGTDNVKWIAGLEVGPFLQSRLHSQLQKVVNYVTGRTTFYPHDVSCNLIRAADHTWMHQDCEPGELDVTLLVYLNPNWTRDMYGETAFFEATKAGGFESTMALRPRFARIAIFNGLFRHSARPPSPVFQGARYSFAVKYAPTRQLAQGKSAEEAGSVESFSGKLTKANIGGVCRELREDMDDIQAGKAKDVLLEEINNLEKRVRAGEELSGEELKTVMGKLQDMQKEVLFREI